MFPPPLLRPFSMKIKYDEVTEGEYISILKCQSSTNWQRVQRGECIFT